MACVQIICNSKDDFPKAGENFDFDGKTQKVLKAKIALKIKRLNLYFVNVFVE